ncbi:hypothetical protein JTE90_015566 [Oedothorax gibbosus]|uniref:DUF659 domain-containing protein n=1 Tax=Oedothorax gibbosus TaxID=931172 RepID=A0AAV6UIY4_9ARAC|nr:hypothetical protein JTE90_015566 [Oedothorax gibbosus]
MENSNGLAQAKAVFSEINKWGAAEKIEAMCFNTTAANTGCWKGTCTLLEQYFEKHLLYLACRHHILELLLKAVFESKFGATTGPQPEMFKKFQMKWPVLDKKQYKFGIEDLLVKIHFSDLEEISGFLLNQLEQKHPREDYKEFLLLCLIFLGRVSPDKISFRAPGAIHHARWMAIYSLKIYIFRQEFSLTPSELESIRSLCIFILKIYVKHWFTAPDAATAPNNDLQL